MDIDSSSQRERTLAKKPFELEELKQIISGEVNAFQLAHAKGWDEGYQAAVDWALDPSIMHRPRNPYRNNDE